MKYDRFGNLIRSARRKLGFATGVAKNFDVERVTDYLFPPDELFPADIAIVFGISSWHLPLQRALELYAAGTVRRLLFTGGFNRQLQAVEANEMANAAIRSGVPSSDVIVEAHATNTAENVSNAYHCIDASIGIEDVNAILLVAIHFHMRRVRLSAQRIFPERIRIGLASYPSAFYGQNNWVATPRGRKDVFSELGKIDRYLGVDLSFLKEN